MKRYIIALVVMVVAGLLPMIYYTNKVNHYYENAEPHSRMIKEIVVDTRNQDCYKDYGVYKIVYRKYNHWTSDSTVYHYWKDSLLVTFWINEQGDTVCIEYRNLNKGRRN